MTIKVGNEFQLKAMGFKTWVLEILRASRYHNRDLLYHRDKDRMHYP